MTFGGDFAPDGEYSIAILLSLPVSRLCYLDYPDKNKLPSK
jgi:hypothetical protein